MTKTYYQKENVYLWYFILVLTIVVLIFGYTVNYLAWQVIPMFAMAGGKIYSLRKTPEIPAIELKENGIVLLTSPESPFYSFADISSIHMDSKSFNGYIRLNNQKKKVRINSVAIALDDQKKIVDFINQKIVQL